MLSFMLNKMFKSGSMFDNILPSYRSSIIMNFSSSLILCFTVFLKRVVGLLQGDQNMMNRTKNSMYNTLSN